MVEIKINLISTWDIKCGIAEYSKFLKNEIDKLNYFRMRICPIKKPSSINPLYFIKLIKRIKNSQIIHIQYQPGIFGHMPILHFSFSYFPLFISILRLLKKNRIIITIHEFSLNSSIDKLILKFLDFSDKLIVLNENLKKLLINNKISKDKIAIIPHGTIKGKILDKEECKKQLGVSNKKVLTIFGYIHKNKGCDLLVDILPKIDKDVVLLVVGAPHPQVKNDYYTYLRIKVSNLNLQDRVRFLGFIKEEELPIVFNATDIAIFPYRWIIVSGALHMALSYIIPVITSDLDYFREIKSKYDCIELFKKNNKYDLCEKIQKLLINEKKQKYLKKRCEKFYEKTNWKAVAEKTARLYLELICGHSGQIYEEKRQKERIDWLKNNKEGTILEIGCSTY